jgi:hypothetical protein
MTHQSSKSASTKLTKLTSLGFNNHLDGATIKAIAIFGSITDGATLKSDNYPNSL